MHENLPEQRPRLSDQSDQSAKTSGKPAKPNDRTVMKAYGSALTMTEPEIVAELMKRHQELVKM